MKDAIYKIWSEFLTQFGKIKIKSFGFIPLLVYDPKPYLINGHDILQIMEFIQPGDVLIRGYDDYLDGKFIPDKRGYSHAGIYVGDKEVIHSASPSVARISIIDFCISDRIMVLRPESGQEEAVKIAESKIGVPYDFNYESDFGKLYCFELIANCYPQANMKEFTVKKLFGLIKRSCYIAKSIYDNPFFKQIYERNEKE